jgi:hypothetical protein
MILRFCSGSIAFVMFWLNLFLVQNRYGVPSCGVFLERGTHGQPAFGKSPDTFAHGDRCGTLGCGNPDAEFTKQNEFSEAVLAPPRGFNVIAAAQ